LVFVTSSKAGPGARHFTAHRADFDCGSKTAIGFADGCFFMCTGYCPPVRGNPVEGNPYTRAQSKNGPIGFKPIGPFLFRLPRFV
jgi:hypothetical protein